MNKLQDLKNVLEMVGNLKNNNPHEFTNKKWDESIDYRLRAITRRIHVEESKEKRALK